MTYPNGGISYEVYCSGVIAQSIRQIHKQAVREGRGETMVAAFREAVHQIEKGARKLANRCIACQSCACKSARR